MAYRTSKALKEALAHALRVADAERRRAEIVEASARRAWALAAWGGARRDRELADADGRA